jgi:hypothetical protein
LGGSLAGPLRLLGSLSVDAKVIGADGSGDLGADREAGVN